jgi:hypothetical protein
MFHKTLNNTDWVTQSLLNSGWTRVLRTDLLRH